MALLMMLLRPLERVLDVVLRLGRWLAVLAIGAMVVCILLQVVMRYGFNNALPWPEEAAIFLMLWMTGLIAPSAYRRGGFVALDVLSAVLPRAVMAGLALVLLFISGVVLVIGLDMGMGEMTSLAGKFKSASLKYPTLDGWEKMPNSWQILSLVVGLALLLAVNMELILRNIITLLGGGDGLRPILETDMAVD